MQDIIEVINRANDAGVGGSQRDLIQKAIKMLADELGDQAEDAGVARSDTAKMLKEDIMIALGLEEPTTAKYLLTFEDDGDFDLSLNGRFLNNGLLFNSPEQLKNIEIHGPYGSPRTEHTKCHSIERWLSEVVEDFTGPVFKGGGNHSLRITEAPDVVTHPTQIA